MYKLLQNVSTFLQVSFANAICTTKGGTHVNYVVDQVTKCAPHRRKSTCSHGAPSADEVAGTAASETVSPRRFIADMILKKNKKSNVKPFMVKNHISVFVNSLIENPAFDSQVPGRSVRCAPCGKRSHNKYCHKNIERMFVEECWSYMQHMMLSD